MEPLARAIDATKGSLIWIVPDQVDWNAELVPGDFKNAAQNNL